MSAPVILELENRRPGSGSCTAGGRTYSYEDFDLPAAVSRAIGMGCTGATFSFIAGGPTPVVECEPWGDTLAAVAVYRPRANNPEGGR